MEAAPLSFTLDATAACCGDADTEAGGSTARVYLKAEDSHGASHELFVGEGDTVVLFTVANGLRGEEVFRTAPLPRGDDGG